MRIPRISGALMLALLLGLVGCGTRGDTTASIPSATPTSASKPSEADRLHPVVSIETSLGAIEVTLDREKAPLTVDNFLAYVDKGFYDQTIFHQVLRNYVILGGAFNSDLKEKAAGYVIRNEAQQGLKNTRGTIAMARLPDVIDSATCQFFINVADNPSLDYQEVSPITAESYGYCAFGRVTQGMEVVDRIAELEVRDLQVDGVGQFDRLPTQMVTIRAIRRVR